MIVNARRRFTFGLLFCAALLLSLLVISPGIGTESATFTLWDAWRARFGWTISTDELQGRRLVDADGDGRISEPERRNYVDHARFVGFDLRLRRSLLALQAGVALALSGASLQVLFRNPLVDPYTLGISGGGALGALVAIRLGWTVAWLGVSAVAVTTFVGAVGVVCVGWIVARGARRFTTNELLLGGITTGLFCGAMMMLITSLSDERVTFETIRWMMGSLDPLASIPAATLLIFLAPACLLLLVNARSLNQLRIGADMAAARGVDVRRLEKTVILATTLATAGVVAHCGPIGFVGLVVPRAVSLLSGPDCRIVLPASALCGGAFMIICDWISQSAMRLAGWSTGRELSGSTLPVGVVTALIGVPVFLMLLRSRRA